MNKIFRKGHRHGVVRSRYIGIVKVTKDFFSGSAVASSMVRSLSMLSQE